MATLADGIEKPRYNGNSIRVHIGTSNSCPSFGGGGGGGSTFKIINYHYLGDKSLSFVWRFYFCVGMSIVVTDYGVCRMV